MIAHGGGLRTIRSFSLTYGYLMQKPRTTCRPSQRRGGCRPIKTFNPGYQLHHHEAPRFTVLGRSVSEAYHDCVLVSEIKRNIIVETLCAPRQAPEYISEEELAYMATQGDA